MRINISIDTGEEGFDKSDTCANLRRLADVFDVPTDTFTLADTRTTPLPEATVTESTPTLADDRVTQMFTESSDIVENGDFKQGDEGWVGPVKDEALTTTGFNAGPTPPDIRIDTPAVPVVPTVDTSAGTAELDANGCPWDERINTATRTQTAKGIWKRKPKIADDLYNSVVDELKGSSSSSQVTTAGVPVITEETPLPPGDDEAINPQEVFMEVVRFNMGLNIGADGITNQLAQRLGLENINHLPQAPQETVAKFKQIFDQVKGIQTLPEAEAVVNMLCPAQS